MKFNFFKKIWGRKEEEKKEELTKEAKEPRFDMVADFPLYPLITEKTLRLSKEGKYTFVIPQEINKVQIKQALEKMFKVKVKKVRTINYPLRLRGVTRLKSKRKKFKKAIVTLAQGQTLDIFE